MIIGIEGRPGSGKSYYALEQIYSCLLRGKVVYSNMRNICIDKVAWSIGGSDRRLRDHVRSRFRILETWELERIWREKIENAEIYLDEVMSCWLSRDWSKMSRELIEFFSQHRKYRVNFTYVAQAIDRVDGTLRDMTQEFITIRNFSFYKIGPVRLPQVFLACHYAEDRKIALKREWIVPIRKYFQFYDSWALFPSKPPLDKKDNVIGIRPGVGPGGAEGRLPAEWELREGRGDLLRRYSQLLQSR